MRRWFKAVPGVTGRGFDNEYKNNDGAAFSRGFLPFLCNGSCAGGPVIDQIAGATEFTKICPHRHPR
jgi:hypothetical protein